MADDNFDEPLEPQDEKPREEVVIAPGSSGDTIKYHLRGMFRNWFLEYASYVIIERAVPHIDDGLKPVQRRLLYSMETLDDGRYIKVANIVGNTMQYHPHGDASIYDALVGLGQKELLIDTQGNWGNILTGASAAAGRYIEARLSAFALETLFNPKITEWTPTYDGRKNEPVVLPVKFPLLLFQGVEGIAVGLSSKILPHNFNEILDAAIAYLKGDEFTLYPDFSTGGLIDVTKYNDGERGGSVKIRAKIEKIDNKTLAVTETPYGKTTGAVIESILKAFEKGKIKIRKVDDNTAETALILVHLLPGTSSDKTIDALYAFTDCEVSISPNCCVISDEKPLFIGVSDVLRHSADTTRTLLGKELQIRLDETMSKLHFASLEKIFIENRIYKDRQFEQSESMDAAILHVRSRIEAIVENPILPITDDDLLRLMEIKMKRILKFSSEEADSVIATYNDTINELRDKLAHLTEYTIEWYEHLKGKYGANYPRRTAIRSFDSIEASTVAEASEKLYINREEGFIGTSLKRDEFVCNCSMLDDVIIFYKDGRYKIVRVAEKLFVDKNIIHIAIFKRNDTRTIYNVIYRDGKGGTYFMKRFAVTGITRDKEYNVTGGKPGSKVMWFSANSNGEAEIVRVTLKPKPKLKTLHIDVDFSKMAIKGKTSRGNIVTKNEIYRLTLKEKGGSTLGGLNVWFDPDILRLNTDGRGRLLGEFFNDDLVLVILDNGEYYTSSFSISNHYEDNILRIEKFDPERVWTAILFDADQGYTYIKRFKFEPSSRRQRFLTDNPESRLIILSSEKGARFEVRFDGNEGLREPLVIDAGEFIGVKSFKAKGKRLTMLPYSEVIEIEPLQQDDEILDNDEETENMTVEEPSVENDIPNQPSDQEIIDEITGQQRLFSDEP